MKKTKHVALIMSVIMLMLIFGSNAVLAKDAEAARTAAFEEKASDELKEKMGGLANSDSISVEVSVTGVDEDAVMQEFYDKYPELFEEYYKAKETDEDVDGDVLQQAIEQKREIFAQHYSNSNGAILKKIALEDEVTFVSQYSPLAILETTVGRVSELAVSPQVTSISYHEENPEVQEFFVNANTEARTKYNRDTIGLKGTGVKIGLIDNGVPSSTNAYLASADITYYNYAQTEKNTHSKVIAVMLVGQGNKGIVPNAKLYACGRKKIGGGTYNFYTLVEWLLSKGVNVISCSIGTLSGSYKGNKGAIWIDHIAVQHDVHFVVAAGNVQTTNLNNTCVMDYGMAYNAITVGAYDEKDTTNINTPSNNSDDTMYTYSCYKESDRTKGNPYCNKPNIVAPGVGIEILDDVYKGTSVATPIVAGAIAQLCSYKAAFKTKQTAVSAILMASAALKVDEKNNSGKVGDDFKTGNITGSEPHRHLASNTQISNREGAGKLNAQMAYNVAKSGNYWSYTKTGSTFTQNISVSLTSGKVTRIALFWLKRVILSSGHGQVDGNTPNIALSKLELRVYDSNNKLVKYSNVDNCNYQIVQFTPASTGKYTIKITKKSGAEKDHFGVALWHK